MKVRKLLALVLAFAMILSTVSFAVSADSAIETGMADFDSNSGVVFDGTNYYDSLVEALAGVHGTDDAVLYCKPDADLGKMTHGHVCKNLTVYGNGAYLSGGEQDFEIDMYKCPGIGPVGSSLTGDVTLTVYGLTGAGVWGTRQSDYVVNYIFEDCANMGKIYLTGEKGTNNITMTDCTFTGNDVSACKVYSNSAGAITLTNVDFAGVDQPVALNNKSTGVQTIVLEDCDFTACGAPSYDWTVPVSVKSSKAGGSSELTVNNCTFTGTIPNSIGQDADILLDYGVGTATAIVENTSAKLGIETEANVASYADAVADDVLSFDNVTAEVKKVVASIGNVYYETLKSAISSAVAGDTIVLVGNVEEGSIKLPSKITNLTIDGNGYTVFNTVINASDGNSVNYQGLTIKNTIFDNSRFVLGGMRGGAVIYKDLVFEGNTFKNIVASGSMAAVHMNIASEDNEYIENFRFVNNIIDGVTGSSNSGVLIKNAKGDVIFEGNKISNVVNNAIQCINAKADINLVITNNELSSNLGAVMNLYNVPAATIENNTVVLNEGQKELGNFSVVAKVGDKLYSSFAAAIAVGGEITLLADTALTNKTVFNKKAVIDLNGYTLDMTAEINGDLVNGDYANSAYVVIAPVTFKNGSINVGNTTAFALDHGLFKVVGGLTFDNVDLTSDGYIAHAFIGAYGPVSFVNGTVVTVKDNGDPDAGFIYGEDPYITVTVADSEMNIANTGRGFVNIELDADDSVINMDALTSNAFRNVQGSINNTDIDVKACENGIKNSSANALKITGDSYVVITGATAYDLVLSGGSTVNVADTAKLIVDTTNVDATSATTGNVVKRADALEVDFELYEEKETEITYDIVLKGIDTETINRLNSADLTFALTQTTGKNIYEIVDVADDHITFNPVYNVADGSIIDGRYEFHFETKTGVANDTASEIVIARVKFTGYGTFGFGVAEAGTNVVHATKIRDNIVETYVPNGDTTSIAEGELVIDNDFSAEIAIPRRALTVKVSFPNGICENDAAYQDMTLSIVGDGVEVNEKLGYGLQKESNGVVYYEFKCGDTILNTPYTVTLEGAGYRTVKYTVNMTEAKTLNFWNNVKDNEVYVEEGLTTGTKKYAQKVTFLAGDIVKDNDINVYDLSAVVSYFGEIDLGKDNKPTYAKYDLNRDGKIDSKDVAYVLVSWGN